MDEHLPTPEGALEARLAKLEAEERDISRQRRRLFDRIDLGADDAYKSRLRLEEQEISRRRRELHRRIDALRAEREALSVARQLGDLTPKTVEADRLPLEGTAG